MAEFHNLGQAGEEEAVKHLEGKGYKILKRNWKAGKHEIDIIAETNEFIVFVEVKTRSEGFLVDPSEAVTREKQRSIIFAADIFLKKHNFDKEGRFDIITVILKGSSFITDHIEGAFYPTLK